MTIPKPDAIEVGGCGVGERPCIKFVYNFPADSTQLIAVPVAPWKVDSPANRAEQIRELIDAVFRDDD